MNGLEGARCVGLHWLFDSTLPADHEEARRRCLECPAILACQRLLADEATSKLSRHGGPAGTWAGRLIGTNRKPREHGTERGYQQHRHIGEYICDPCRHAHNASVRRYQRKAS